MMPHCLIIAHRGASGYLEGNTLEAFQLALAHGADAIEMDVRQTKDHQIIVMHDTKVRRGRKKIPVGALTLDEIISLGGSVLLLRDVLMATKSKTILDIDIKEPGFEKELVMLLRTQGIRKDQVLLNCKRLKILETIRLYWPDAPVVLSFVVLDGFDLAKRRVLATVVTSISIGIRRVALVRFKRKVIRHRLYGVSLPYTFVDKRLVELFHRHNIKVYAWPPYTEKAMRRLLVAGVDGIKTGKPDVLKKILEATL